MDAGARDQLIAIERKAETPDGAGGVSVLWTEVGRMYAAVRWLGGGEADADHAARERNRYRFTVLSAAADDLAIGVADRIVWDGDVLNIRERPTRLRQSPETELVAETGTAT